MSSKVEDVRVTGLSVKVTTAEVGDTMTLMDVKIHARDGLAEMTGRYIVFEMEINWWELVRFENEEG
jgi:hypothetical protein